MAALSPTLQSLAEKQRIKTCCWKNAFSVEKRHCDLQISNCLPKVTLCVVRWIGKELVICASIGSYFSAFPPLRSGRTNLAGRIGETFDIR